MAWVDTGDLPSHRDGKRFFLLTGRNTSTLPFPFTGGRLLSPNGGKLVKDFHKTMGECLGGGVLKSKDLDRIASKSPMSQQIHQQVKAQLASVPAREAMRLSAQLQSEWISFEYCLVLSVTAYGHLTTIDWDNLHSVKIGSKGIFGSGGKAVLDYRTPKGAPETVTIEANREGITTLGAIARACGVPVA